MELRRRGYRLAIGSSSKNAGMILRHLGLENWFNTVADGNDIQRSKPDPQVFLLAAERLRLPPECCLVVEDARAGLEAAHTGGFACAALGDAAKGPGADYRLSSFPELLNLLS